MNLFKTKSVDQLQASAESSGLKRVLGSFDLILLGIGAIIGAGIFSTLGSAAVGEPPMRLGAGPALSISFGLLGIVCALAGLCYSELTALIPVSGSAYTYAYATLGELIAWIIGWDLILEYAIGNVYVAISWSGYFTSLLEPLGVKLPYAICHGYGDVIQQLHSAQASFRDAFANLFDTIAAHVPSAAAASAATLTEQAAKIADRQGHLDAAPHLLGLPLLVNLPAFVIVMIVTWLLVIGIKESTRTNNIMVGIKLLVLALFVGVGIFHINPDNWHPFAPNGFQGIAQGAAVAFFAYIGFDAVSTAAEETKNPQKSMPIGILGSLAICTVIYMIIAIVATGMVPFEQLTGPDPLARALGNAGLPWFQFVLSVGAVISMSAVLLVFQLGQPRIFFAMSRDGLLPQWFNKVHPKYKTPHVTTIVTGLVVGVLAAVMDDDITLDLTNVGTLSAFAIVCLGVIVLRITQPNRPRPFKVPLWWLVAPAGIAACAYTMYWLPHTTWWRFGVWLAAGLLIYVIYGYRNSALRRRT